MTPDRSTVITTPARLAGRTEARGTGSGMGVALALVFGLVAIGAGSVLIAGWLGYLTLESEGEAPPGWVMPTMGLMFVCVGLWICGLGARAWHAERARAARFQQFMGRPERIDHDWDPKGDSPSRVRPFVVRLGWAVFLTLFLAPFNMVFWQTDAPDWVRIIVGIFDALGVVMWIEAGRALIHALKFSVARLEYTRFPYRVGETVELRWWPPAGLGEVLGGKFTLRCVREWWEETGSGRSRSRTLVHEAQWQGCWAIEQRRTLGAGQPVLLRFELPEGLPPTKLALANPFFWELEVELEVAGVDYHAMHLVPVY